MTDINQFINTIVYPSQTVVINNNDNDNKQNTQLPSNIQHEAVHSHRLRSVKPQYGCIQRDNIDPSNQHIIKQYGILQHANKSYTINAISNIYIPQPNDLIIGTIQSKTSEYYRVNLGDCCNISAILPIYNFVGASKRNHPNLKIGSIVYCIISHYIPNCNDSIELTCISSFIKQKDWVNTNENIFGQLVNGLTYNVSLTLVNKLLQPDNIILKLIETKLKITYELAIGFNGIIWLHSNSIANTIVILNIILKTEHMNRQQQIYEINQFIKRSQGE